MKVKSNVLVTLALSLATFSGAYANGEQYLSSDPIDINGYVRPQAKASDQELEQVKSDIIQAKQMSQINKEKAKNYKKLVEETEELSETSEELIQERKEAQAEIAKYQTKVDCLMGRVTGEQCDEFVKQKKQDELKLKQAAPVVEHEVAESNSEQNIKVLPYTGLMTFNGINETLESELSAGLRVESDISERFSIGLGVGYTSLRTNDIGANPFIQQGFVGFYNQFIGPREIEYNALSVDLYSKYFLLKGERFRPYIGFGGQYSRGTLEYTNNNVNGFNNFGYQFNNEEVISSNFSGQLLAGSEVLFTDTIGLNLELSYTKSFSNNINSQQQFNAFAPDQRRLQELSQDLNEADIFGVFAGMIVLF